MTRRRFSEREVIATLINQGVVITSYRSGEQITLENVKLVEREHLHEIALGGPDIPANCRYSLKAEHAIITNGTKATTAGSSKHRIAKADRIASGGKVVRRPMPKVSRDIQSRAFPSPEERKRVRAIMDARKEQGSR